MIIYDKNGQPYDADLVPGPEHRALLAQSEANFSTAVMIGNQTSADLSCAQVERDEAQGALAEANEKAERYRRVTLKQDAENEALQTESGKLRVLLIRANKWVRIIDERRNEVPQWLRHDGDPHPLRADINAALAAAKEAKCRERVGGWNSEGPV